MWKSVWNKIKEAFRKMIGNTTLEQKLNITPAISNEMRNAIELWTNMYQDKSPWLKEPTHADPVKITSLGLPAMIASEKARMVVLELKSDINQINKSNDLNSQNTPVKEEKENKNYEQFDINKDYYLTCPDCNNINNNYFIQKIDSIDYISDEKDFKLIYKCFSELNDSNKKEKYLYELITEMPKCDVHDNENLIFFCNN